MKCISVLSNNKFEDEIKGYVNLS